MGKDIDEIFKNSTKAEFIEVVSESLKKYDKAIIVFLADTEKGYVYEVKDLGVERDYEVLGILRLAEEYVMNPPLAEGDTDEPEVL